MRRITRNEEGCEVWEGGLDRDGYGKVTVGGKSWRVHILMRQLYYGEEASEGKILHHRCGEKRCCNPEHLEWVSRVEHMAKHRGDKRQVAGKNGDVKEWRLARRKGYQRRAKIGRPRKGLEIELDI